MHFRVIHQLAPIVARPWNIQYPGRSLRMFQVPSADRVDFASRNTSKSGHMNLLAEACANNSDIDGGFHEYRRWKPWSVLHKIPDIVNVFASQIGVGESGVRRAKDKEVAALHNFLQRL